MIWNGKVMHYSLNGEIFFRFFSFRKGMATRRKAKLLTYTSDKAAEDKTNKSRLGVSLMPYALCRLYVAALVSAFAYRNLSAETMTVCNTDMAYATSCNLRRLTAMMT